MNIPSIWDVVNGVQEKIEKCETMPLNVFVNDGVCKVVFASLKYTIYLCIGV